MMVRENQFKVYGVNLRHCYKCVLYTEFALGSTII